MTDVLEVAVRAARAAGALLLDRFGGDARGLGVKTSDTDPVSDADRDAEALIVRVLRRDRPGDGVLAEEGGVRESDTGLTWVVDPLDGTVNYLYGIPHWAVSIAVDDEHGPLAGAVHDPGRGETFAAARGGGATLNGSPVRVSGCSDLGRALLATGFAYAAPLRVAEAGLVAAVIDRVRDIRRAGTASLDLAWVACGRVDAYAEWGLSRWDLSAGSLVVREAGGAVTPLPRSLDGADGICASSPAIHRDLLALLAAGGAEIPER